MFDLSNLNDYEFEVLCKDIMQEKLSEELFMFSRGVDAGIDICDKEIKPTIIIQVKHYVGSAYSQLKSSLNIEIEKMKNHKPKRYFVCTSQSLTRKNKLEIVEMFNEYMTDISYIIDRSDINSFLEDESNKDIVVKNYKLWLCASNVLSIVNNQSVFIDCTELMFDIETQIKLFVETQAYRDAKKKLNKDNIIIIVGAPGVGKSTVSKMLLLHYADKGYKVRYVTNNNISEIKRSLSISPSKKEIVLLDDFLGQHYLKLKDSQPNELKTLIAFVERNKNKKIILNSRITILNEATQTYLIFKGIMERYEENKYILDLDRMSQLEKAKILYNHIYFNGLPAEYFSQIKKDKRYLQIVSHANYNPRIIEYVTKKNNYTTIFSKNYMKYIKGKLDNPEDVWKDEFRNRLEIIDRIFMHTLYSLSDTTVDNTVLERAFNQRILREVKCDTSVNQYREAMLRLTDSLIKNVDDRGIVKIASINPSVNDYLYSEITSNPNEQIAIIDNAVFYEQIFKALKSDVAKLHYKEKMLTYDYLKMETMKNSAFFYFLKSIIELEILEKSLKRKIIISVERSYANLHYQDIEEYGQILYNLYTGKYCEFYKLHDVFLSSDKMFYILKPLMLNKTVKFINKIMMDYDILDDEELIEVFKEHLLNKITDYVKDEIANELTEIVSCVTNGAKREEIAAFNNGSSTYLEDNVWSELQDLALEKINDYIATVNNEIDISDEDFDVSTMCSYLDISDSIESVLRVDYDEDDDIRYSYSKSDTSLIEAMFER